MLYTDDSLERPGISPQPRKADMVSLTLPWPQQASTPAKGSQAQEKFPRQQPLHQPLHPQRAWERKPSPHSTCRETEAQRGKGTCSKPTRYHAELGFNPGSRVAFSRAGKEVSDLPELAFLPHFQVLVLSPGAQERLPSLLMARAASSQYGALC